MLVGLLVLTLTIAPGAGAAPVAYISNFNDGTVSVVDGTTVIKTVTVGPQPVGVAVSPDETRVYVANSNFFGDDVPSVSVINTADFTVTTIKQGIAGQPSGVTVSADNKFAYVADIQNGAVFVIDAATNTVVSTLTPPPTETRQVGAVVAAGGSVYATDLVTGEVFNLTNPSVLPVFVSFSMMGIAANSDGSRLFIANRNDSNDNLEVTVVDTTGTGALSILRNARGQEVRVQVSRSGTDAGTRPGGIAVSSTGFVYVPVLVEHAVVVLNATTNAIVTRIPPLSSSPRTPFSEPFGAAVDPAGARVYIGNSGNGTATVLDGTTNTVVASGITIGGNPMAFGSFVAGDRPMPPPQQFTLSLNTTGPGSITAEPASPNGQYTAGTPVKLTANPDGSVFASWGGACAGVTTNPCTVTMSTNQSVTANFTALYTLYVTVLGPGTVKAEPPSTTGKYLDGAVVKLTAQPGTDAVFTSWDGACKGVTGTVCNVTMNLAKSVTATFTAQYALVVATSGPGTVEIDPPSTTGKYLDGTAVKLTARPGTDAVFTSWDGACRGVTGTICNVTMSAARSVSASFTAQFSLSVTISGTGTVMAEPQLAKYLDGASVKLTAQPGTGFQFTSWGGACQGVTGLVCTVTMNGNKTVTATFTAVAPPPPAPTTCDDKIKDLEKKVASDKHPWRHEHQLKAALRLYSAAQVELGKAKTKVGPSDKRYVRALKEFNNGKAALCNGRYWHAHHELWESYYLAHEILKHHRR